MAENPVETGQQMMERWRKHEALERDALRRIYETDFQVAWKADTGSNGPRTISADCADEFAAFLSRLRELSAEFRGKVVNVKSGYWKDKPTEMTKKYKEIADTLDALIGERVTGGEKGQ